MQDDIDAAAVPRCPECGTVLVDVTGGYECRSCQLTFLPGLPNDLTEAE